MEDEINYDPEVKLRKLTTEEVEELQTRRNWQKK